MALLDQIEVRNLDEDQRELAELIGIETYRRLVKTYGGTSVYIPKAESLEKAIRDKLIKEEFDGSNYRELAKRYGLTEAWVRSITQEKMDEIRRTPIPGQMDISDFLTA